jgi:hypothetical protein
MMVSASSGTTSQAIFSITSRLALDSASRSNASPPSAGGGTTLRAGLCAAEGTGRSGVGVDAAVSSTTSSSSGMSSSSSRAGAGGGGRAAAGGCDGRGGGGGGFDAGAALGLATGAPGMGGFAAGDGGLGAGGGADGAGLATAGGGGRGGFDVGVAPAGMGGRAITIVLPAPGETAGAETAGLGAGCGGFELRAGGAGGLGGAEEAGAMTGFAFGFARMVLTCSMSFALSNGFGMCPFAPTAIALAGSMGAGPPSSSTGTSFNEASPRTR